MRHLGLCATAALCTLAFSGLQAQVLKNNSRPEVIFINRGGIEIDSMVTSEVIETYYSTIERDSVRRACLASSSQARTRR